MASRSCGSGNAGLTDRSRQCFGIGAFFFRQYKLLELLKEIAPGVTRVAVLRDPANPGLVATFGAVRGAAHLLGVEVTAIDTRCR